MTTEQPPDHRDTRQRLARAWDTYQTIQQARTEASAAVTAELAVARAKGISMYRMAKWLNVSERTIQARLEKHDQTNTPPPPAD